VIAATQRDLEPLVAGQRFRSDLLARLSGLTIEMPPLRSRRPFSSASWRCSRRSACSGGATTLDPR